MKRLLPAVAVALVAIAVVAAGQALARSSGDEAVRRNDVLGPGDVTVTLSVRHSRFTPDRVRVRPGTTVRFVVENADPIGHELIVGDEDVHRRHENGTEPYHEPRPGEVTVPATATAETTFAFPTAGEIVFACHIPGHFKYGMKGVIEVVPA